METLDRSKKIREREQQRCSPNNAVSKTLPDLAELLQSWKLVLRVERKAPATVASYSEGVFAFLR